MAYLRGGAGSKGRMSYGRSFTRNVAYRKEGFFLGKRYDL